MVMKACKYCGREFPERGLPLHMARAHPKQLEARKVFAKQEAEINAQVHEMVENKKRELALAERRQRLSDELQSLANDIENSYKPLTICNQCGGTWDNHKVDCPFKQTSSDFDQFLDFMIALLGGSQ
jgi:hypothetical protein